MSRSIAAVAAAAALSAAFAARAQEAPQPPTSAPVSAEAPSSGTKAEALAAFEAAKANLPLAKTRAKVLKGSPPADPAGERALGHHGKVVVQGVVGPDGRLDHALVAAGTGAPVLDALALGAARDFTYEPSRDAAGAPLPTPISLPFEFYWYKSGEPGGGLIRYSCRQFALDMDWWRATFPDLAWSKHELYVMLLGVSTMGHMAGKYDISDLPKWNADFAKRWGQAIDACRANPDKRLVDVLQPEGRLSEALAKVRG